MICTLVTLLLLPAVVDDAAIDAQLQAIERGYASAPGSRWEREAEQLASQAPNSQAAGRALLWIASLAQHDGRGALAARRYDEVKHRFPTGEIAALADRGLGDLALQGRRWSDAIARYGDALPNATPVLRYELDAKIRIAERERGRWHWEIAAWIVFVLCLFGLAAPLKAWRPSVPFEVKLLAPVYVALVVAAWGRDEHVPIAMCWIATGSLFLVGVRRADAERRVRDAALLVVGSAAMIYIGLFRANVLGPLLETLRKGSAPL